MHIPITFAPMSVTTLAQGIFDWRSWHHHIKYIPLTPVWLWYCLRAKSFWFFTATDPSLTFGGFEGEGKEEMYLQFPQSTYPKTIFVSADIGLDVLEKQVAQNQFSYPFIVKPDVGMMGFMFRKISDAAQLRKYHEAIGEKYLVQELVTYPLEVSVFYYRMPNASRGKISGFISKEPAKVVGDGTSTLQDLIINHPNKFVQKERIVEKFSNRLAEVPPAGAVIRLSDASNRKQGGEFRDLSGEIDDTLLQFFDELSLRQGNLYYGRYDILCESVADLKARKNFKILEFNGTGAGPQHFIVAKSFWEVEKIILEHWRMMFLIAKANMKLGIKPWPYAAGLKHIKLAKKHLQKLLHLDANFPQF